MPAPAKDDEITEEHSFETDSPLKKGATKKYTFAFEVDGKAEGEVAVSQDASWRELCKAAHVKLGFDVDRVQYDDKFGPDKEDNIECKEEEDWQDLLIMMDEDDQFIKGKLTLRVQSGKVQKLSAAVVKTAVISYGSAKPAVPEAVVRKLLLAKGRILEGCATMDKSGLGLVTTAELSKQLQEIIGCSATEADLLVLSGGAWRDIVPNGQGKMVDYRMFCLRARLVDREEAALLSNLSNADLQAARMAVLERSSDFKDALSGFEGQVSAKQCEQLLKEKGLHLMSNKHASALCASPGSAAAQKDMRTLVDELELVDTFWLHRSPLLNHVILGCVRDFASSNETKLNEALAASTNKSGVLPSDKFCAVYEKMDSDAFCCAHSLLDEPSLPHTMSKTILTPMLSAATGGLRQDCDINCETFANDFSIAHDNEIQLLRAGRRASLQRLRRMCLKERKDVQKSLASTPSMEQFKKAIMAKPLSFSAGEADEMCADVPKGSNGQQDPLEHLQSLQFSEILGTGLDDCAEHLFSKYDDLCSSCVTKEPSGKEGSIRMEDFADAMDLVSVDSEKAKKVRQVLSDEGVELVAWRELLECRMRVLSWRELEILAQLRERTQQAIRVKVVAVAARVFVSLSEDASDDGMVESATLKAKLLSVGSLSEGDADSIVKVLQHSAKATTEKICTIDMLGFRSYTVSHDCDGDAIKTLMFQRQSFLTACCGTEHGSAALPAPRQLGPEVDVTAVRSAMHRVNLAAWSVDAVMACADRAPSDVSKVQVGAFLSRVAVVTHSERRRLEALADDKLQLARLALLILAPTGDSGPKERLNSLVTDLTKKVTSPNLSVFISLQRASSARPCNLAPSPVCTRARAVSHMRLCAVSLLLCLSLFHILPLFSAELPWPRLLLTHWHKTSRLMLPKRSRKAPLSRRRCMKELRLRC